MSTLINLKDVSKIYKLGKSEVQALQNTNISIDKGEFTCIKGPSGSGKSTLLHIIGCIEEATSGVVEIHGQQAQSMSDKELSYFRNRHIGFIFQSFNLVGVLNTFENIEYPLAIRREKINKQKIMDAIESVGLQDYIKHRPDELSGGQRQRVAIARAIVTEPDIILADEPTANLDSKTGQKIVDILLQLNKERGTTFLFSTHNDLVAKLAKKTYQMVDGQLKLGRK